jgi:hypothetical protein
MLMPGRYAFKSLEGQAPSARERSALPLSARCANETDVSQGLSAPHPGELVGPAR